HLQRNKVRRSLQYRPIIHSIDSPRLLECVAEESHAAGFVTQVMLEVNVSGEANKTGMDQETLEVLVERCSGAKDGASLRNVEVIGLMAMAGWGTDLQAARQQFSLVRKLRDHLRATYRLPLSQLSMGMSGDFQAAIAEGATMVRIGSRLFEGVMEKH
ncbi:alanine racemase, partial [Rubripirellula amarantea]|nr:alanine racemase [Rubripirellula amarantea]